MGAPLDVRSAREALIVEALGGVDTVLAAADAVGERLTARSQRLEAAAAGLATAGSVYAAEVAQLTEATKKALADFIERRTSAATAQALADHRSAMKDAANLAFAEQLAPAVRDIARQVELHASLVRTRLAPLAVTFVVGAGIGIACALIWMR
jgi:molybdopterin converting factor small subunit